MALKDERGEIVNIARGEFKAVQLITSKAGSVRSNHYHQHGGHWLYVLSGRMIYLEREYLGVAKYGEIFKLVLGPGDKVFTGPLMIHRTEFPEDTILISCAITPLDHETYESDTVRLWGAFETETV